MKLSLVVTMAPSCRSLANAIGTSSLLQLLTPSAMMYTLCPALSKSMAVCVTQMWLSMPTMMQANGPVALRLSSAFLTSGVLDYVRTSLPLLSPFSRETYTMENLVLSKWHMVLTPPGASRPSSGHVSPNRALFCVVAKTGMFKI